MFRIQKYIIVRSPETSGPEKTPLDSHNDAKPEGLLEKQEEVTQSAQKELALLQKEISQKNPQLGEELRKASPAERHRLLQFYALKSKSQDTPIIRELLGNTEKWADLRPSDILILKQKGVDIAPLLLLDPKESTRNITRDSIRTGDTFVVNFGSGTESDQINRQIGIGDILPRNIGVIEVTDKKGVTRKGTWKPAPRIGYYTSEGRYIPVFSGYTVKILNDSQTLSPEVTRQADTTETGYSEERRVQEMVEAGIIPKLLGILRRKNPEEMKQIDTYIQAGNQEEAFRMYEKLITGLSTDTALMSELRSMLPTQTDMEIFKQLLVTQIQLDRREVGGKDIDTNESPVKGSKEFLEKYGTLLADLSENYGIPQDLIIRLVGRESRFRQDAKNPYSSAYGFGQIIDSTWNGINRKKFGGTLKRTKGEDQLRATCYYLYELASNGNCDYADAFVLYHTGPGISRSNIQSLKSKNAPVARMMRRYGLPDTPEGYKQGAAYFYGVNEFRGSYPRKGVQVV